MPVRIAHFYLRFEVVVREIRIVFGIFFVGADISRVNYARFAAQSIAQRSDQLGAKIRLFDPVIEA